ncbi:MAG TPA: hypothetical protein VHR18_13460 [Solirubrobacterales bacterium]|nr:hypothetical protein [Solirubrobacterales bacterium]
MSDTETDGHVDDALADLLIDDLPVRQGRPLPANIIRRPVQLPPMERVQADA